MFLNRIVAQTKNDLEEQKRKIPLEEIQRLALEQPQTRDFLAALTTNICLPTQPVPELQSSSPLVGTSAQLSCPEGRDGGGSRVHLIAEVKRASPSKGMLAPHLDPVALARLYEANGASAISVLTERHFFLGAPEYLTAIKQAVNLPVLRKDFIVDDYQIYEARAWGADVILLICAILDDEQLQRFIALAHDLHMHCLVETHTSEEAQRAIKAGAKIIGVNSRDLTTFQMNPHLLREIRPLIPPDRVLIAESGIHTETDARRLARHDVCGMLVGESLVVSNDIPAQMRSLLHGANQSTQVKICGLKTAEHINVAIDAGADLLGFIFHEPSHRYIDPQLLYKQNIMESALAAKSRDPREPIREEGSRDSLDQAINQEFVGVFVNKEASYINDLAEQIGLHYVQLHGTETPEFCQQIKRPVIKALQIREQADLGLINAYQAVAWRILLDTPTPNWGGSGETHDWQLAQVISQSQRIILAGGLTIDNVAAAIALVQPWGIDTSSGVETNRQKDSTKIRTFVQQVRTSDNKLREL